MIHAFFRELRPILLEHGWINLFHPGDGDPAVYSAEEHREWLRRLIPRLTQTAHSAG